MPSGPQSVIPAPPGPPADPAPRWRREALRPVALAALATVAVWSTAAPLRAASARDGGRVASTGAGARGGAAAADTQTVVLRVTGMSCTSCERTLATLLRRTPGVAGAAVSVARGEAVVRYDPRRTTAAQLVAVVERLGYTAAVRPVAPS